MVLIEPAVNNFPILEERFAGESRVRLVHGYLEGVSQPLSADSLIAVTRWTYRTTSAFAGCPPT